MNDFWFAVVTCGPFLFAAGLFVAVRIVQACRA